MENLVKKTMTAFLVLLTLMIPVSAGTYSNAGMNTYTVEEGTELLDVYVGYSATSDEEVNITYSGAALYRDYVDSFNVSANTTLGASVTSRLLLADNLEAGNYSIQVSIDSNVTGTTSSVTPITLTVNPDIVDELEANLVADNDYEEEVSPGDTIVLELELENGNTIYNDVSLEAYLVDALNNGKRVSDIQETGDFNLGVEEQEVVTMEFLVEDDLDEGTYYIYVIATSDETSEGESLFEEMYEVTVERDEHSLVVTDLRVSNAAAGETVDVAVTILNNGQTDEDNVLVSLSVAGQTVTSDYFTVEEDEELVRYFTLTLPSGASGNELVTVAVANEDVSVSSSTTVNVEARNQAASLTEEQVAALLEARLNQGNNNGFDDLSLGWLVAGLLVVYLLVSNRGLMPTTSRAASTSSRGRRSSKKYY